MGADERRLVSCPNCGEPMTQGGECASCAAWGGRASGPGSFADPDAAESYALSPNRAAARSSTVTRAPAGGGRGLWVIAVIVLLVAVAAGVAVYVTVFRGAQAGVHTEQEQLYYADVARAQTRIMSQDAVQITVLQSLGTEPPADQLAAADQACADLQAVYAEWKDRAAPTERLVKPTAAWVAAMGRLATSAAAVRAAIAAGDRAPLPAAAQQFSLESAKYAIAAQSVLLPGQ
jgi:hypothetical protein